MSAAPLPPFLPSSPDDFAEHTAKHNREWYDYCRQAYEYIEKAETAISEANERASQSELQVQVLRRELSLKEEEIACLHKDHNQISIKYQAVQEYQKEQLREMEQKYFKAMEEKSQALRLAVPTVDTPLSTPTPKPVAEKPVATSVGAPPSIASPSSETTRLSERLPDPDRFEGDRKDLRRFVSQIHEKMNVNRDRFPTPPSRMTYVTNRLKGDPYNQILPYIHEGVCQLSDYKDILKILERAFGDPNKVRNARNELFRLRQTNKEFSAFFAEFQRLALEGEMPEDTLPTLLEQAINRELRGMLLHHEPPSWEYHQFADFLQGLENRRRHYESNLAPASRTYAAVSKSVTSPLPPRPGTALPPQPAKTPLRSVIPENKETYPDVMDLSLTRRTRQAFPATTRRERGECFRCGSTEHLVRDCPHPDNRPVKARSMTQNYSPVYSSPPLSPRRGRSPPLRSPSPDRDSSVKGVSPV